MHSESESLDHIIGTLLEELEADFTFVSKLDPSKDSSLKTISIFQKGSGKIDNFSYEIEGTPCENVMRKQTCIVPNSASAKYPNDEMLVEAEVQAYLGVPVYSIFDGHIVGSFGAMFTSDLSKDVIDDKVAKISILSPRVELELDRHILSKRLEDSKSLFDAITNQTTEGITVADPEGNYLFVNKAFCKMSGYSEEELLGMTVFDMKAKNQNHKSFYDSKEEYEGVALRVNLQRKDGTEYLTEIIGDNIEFEGRTVVLGTIRDISDKVKWEERIKNLNKELEQKVEARTKELNDSLEVKQVLLNEITHRVKNNLQVIASILNIQKETVQTEESRNICKETSDRIHSMALIHEILYKNNEFKNVNFKDYLDSLIKHFQEVYDVSDRIEFVCQCDDSILAIDHATCCGMIASELITNAIKYGFPNSEKGIIQVKFNSNSDHHTFEVEDNGVGLPSDFSLENSNTLGVQIVDSLVSQLDGRISIYSEEGTKIQIQFDS